MSSLGSYLVNSWIVENAAYLINTGIVFGLNEVEVRQLSLALSLLVLWIYMRWHTFRRGEKFGLSLIVGGAVANMLSRLEWGGVVDYWEFFEMFSFNLSDVWISMGVVIFIYSSVVSYFPKRKI